MAKQAIVLMLGGLVVAGVALRLGRARLLTTRYAIGWLGFAVFVIAAAALMPFFDRVGRVANITPTGLLLVLSSATLLAVAIQLSISVSQLQLRLGAVVQALARVADDPGTVAATDGGAPRTIVVIPAFNESESIGDVLDEVATAGFECVVIDDASTDRTASIAEEHGVPVVRLPINLGVGGALKAGFGFAVRHGYARVVQIDADGQHLATEIPRLLEHADSVGADMVVGSRFASDDSDYSMSWVRRRCVSLLANRVRTSGVEVSDPTSGFRTIGEPLLSEFALDFPAHYLGDTFEALVVAGRRGYSVAEIPVAMRPRQGGRPSADLKTLVRSMIRSLAVTLTGPTFDVRRRQ